MVTGFLLGTRQTLLETFENQIRGGSIGFRVSLMTGCLWSQAKILNHTLF